jgi:enoyl-CoA hydratase
MNAVRYEVDGHIANITLNRPDALNAFNYEMLLQLEAAVESVRVNETVRVVTITGAGEKAFSAGADLKERKSLTVGKSNEISIKLVRFLPRLNSFPSRSLLF